MTNDPTHGLGTIRPAQNVSTAPVLARYLGGDPRLEERLGGNPTDLAAVRAAVDAVKNLDLDRAALVETLARTNRSFDAAPATLANIEALATPDTFCVVTGQQPGLLTGPLYSLYKAAAVIALARRYSAEVEGARFVPVFWIASDDHDLPEVESCSTLDENLDLRRFRVPLGPVGSPMSGLRVDATATETLAAFVESMPRGDFRDDVAELAAPRQEERWPEWFGRILLALFPDDGLILFEPALAAHLIGPWLEREAADPGRMPAALAEGARRLEALDLPAPLPADATSSLFVVDGDGRRRRFDSAVSGSADDLAARLARADGSVTPDASLRPLVQSLVLPTPVTVGGPGELAYWLQLTEAFDVRYVPRPVFVPRFRATLIEPRVRRALTALELDEDSLFLGEEELERTVVLAEPDEAGTWREGADRARASLEELATALADVGGPVPKRIKELRKSFGSSLDRLLAAAADVIRERSGASRKRLRLIARSGLPGGKPQERVFNGLPFLSRHGLDLYSRLAAAMDPLDFRHVFIQLETVRTDDG